MSNTTLIWRIASRYLWGKRTANAVPVLSRISMGAITVGSAAMIIVFSVFNGFDFLVKDYYKAFYPDIKISTKKGKFFPAAAIDLNSFRKINGVQHVTGVIEDNVLVSEETEISGSNNEQLVVTLKGIDHSYLDVNNIREYITGADSVNEGEDQTAIIGLRNMHVLGADINNVFSKIDLFYPNPTLKNPESDPDNAFEELKLHPAGVFHIVDDFETKFILAPLSLSQHLFHKEGMYSSVELSVSAGEINHVKERLTRQLGSNYQVENRYEQNRTLYMVMGTEKWAVYFILLMVMGIASFNMVGALGMLVMEKRKDIAMMHAMGAEYGLVRKVFLLEGVLWALTGGISGIMLGCLVCFAQQKYSLIKLSGDFLVEAYPVRIEFTDLVLVLVTIIVVGFVAAWIPAKKANATSDPSLKSS